MTGLIATASYVAGFWLAAGWHGLPFRRWTRRNAAAVVGAILIGAAVVAWLVAVGLPWIAAVRIAVAPGLVVGLLFTYLVKE